MTMWPFSDEEDQEQQAAPVEQPSRPLDPTVANYMKQKIGLDDSYKKAQADAKSSNTKAGIIEGLSTMFAGRDKTDGSFYNNLRAQNNAAVDRADNERKGLAQQFQTQRQLSEWENSDKDLAEERDPNSSRSEIARNVAKKFGQDKLIPPEKLATMSAADIKKFLPHLQNAYDADIKSQMVGEAAKTRKQAHDDAAALRAIALQDKKDQANAAIAVPGFNLTGQVKPGQVEAKDARDALATYNDMTQNLDDLRSLVEKNGSFEYGGEAGTKMGGLATDIRLQLKQLAKLGVLSKSDYDLLDKQIQDPSSLKSMFSKDSSSLAQIDQLKDLAGRKISNGMASKGYAPDEAMAKRLAGSPKKRVAPPGTAFAATSPNAPAIKPVHEMTEAEIDEELKALGQ